MITVTDIFAGAGGSTTGMTQVDGVHVEIAANHWKLAIDVHGDNHPDTNHAHVDLHLEDPRNFPKTDILWASPECTKWSQANSKAKKLSVEMGGDPTLFDHIPVELETGEQDEINRSRLLMFDVLRFIEHHRYRMVWVENVVDIATQTKYRAAWALWQKNLRRLGYNYRVVSLNSMHAQLAGLPAPQSRDRLFIAAWPEGTTPPNIDRALSPPAYCPRCERIGPSVQMWKPGRTVGRYRAQYVYGCRTCHTVVEPAWLGAVEAIDWSLLGERIGDRKRPLSEKTMNRIREGMRMNWAYLQEGMPLVHRNYSAPTGQGGHLTKPVTDPLGTITTADHHSLLTPFVLEAAGNTYDAADPKHPRHGQPGSYVRAWPIDEPLRTLHTTMSKALLVPFVLDNNFNNRGVSTDRPLPTLTTATNKGLIVPVEGRTGKRAAPADLPLRTQATRNETALLVPYYSNTKAAKPVSDPMGTITTVDRHALVTLRGTNTPKHVRLPMDTVTAGGNHHGLVDITEEDVMAARFRMLEPHEIAAGMAFPHTYQWQGTKRERVRLAGNAVTPPAARDLMAVTVETLRKDAA